MKVTRLFLLLLISKNIYAQNGGFDLFFDADKKDSLEEKSTVIKIKKSEKITARIVKNNSVLWEYKGLLHDQRFEIHKK